MAENEPLQPQATVVEARAGKPYQKPVLKKLGSLRDVTLTVNRDGAADGARTGNRRNTGRGGHYGAAPERSTGR